MDREAASGRKVVKPKARSAASKAVVNDALDPGDKIEFSITAEVKKNGRSFWVKGGATGTIRPDEDPDEAKGRIEQFVITMVDDQITDYLG